MPAGAWPLRQRPRFAAVTALFFECDTRLAGFYTTLIMLDELGRNAGKLSVENMTAIASRLNLATLETRLREGA